MGVEPIPREPAVSVLRIAGCRQPAIHVDKRAANPAALVLFGESDSRTARAEASGRSAQAPVAAAPLTRLGAAGCFRAKRIP